MSALRPAQGGGLAHSRFAPPCLGHLGDSLPKLSASHWVGETTTDSQARDSAVLAQRMCFQEREAVWDVVRPAQRATGIEGARGSLCLLWGCQNCKGRLQAPQHARQSGPPGRSKTGPLLSSPKSLFRVIETHAGLLLQEPGWPTTFRSPLAPPWGSRTMRPRRAAPRQAQP